MSHLLVLRHGPLVGPDTLVRSLDERAEQLPWVEHDLTQDPTVPSLDDVAGLLVLGGIMGVHDDDAWLEPERELLRQAKMNEYRATWADTDTKVQRSTSLLNAWSWPSTSAISSVLSATASQLVASRKLPTSTDRTHIGD